MIEFKYEKLIRSDKRVSELSNLETFTAEISKEKIPDKENYFLYSATINGVLVGFSVVEIEADKCHSRYTYVAEQLRKKGIATLLLKKRIETEKANGIKEIYCAIHRGNTESINLYKKLGFEFSNICGGFEARLKLD